MPVEFGTLYNPSQPFVNRASESQFERRAARFKSALFTQVCHASSVLCVPDDSEAKPGCPIQSNTAGPPGTDGQYGGVQEVALRYQAPHPSKVTPQPFTGMAEEGQRAFAQPTPMGWPPVGPRYPQAFVQQAMEFAAAPSADRVCKWFLSHSLCLRNAPSVPCLIGGSYAVLQVSLQPQQHDAASYGRSVKRKGSSTGRSARGKRQHTADIPPIAGPAVVQQALPQYAQQYGRQPGAPQWGYAGQQGLLRFDYGQQQQQQGDYCVMDYTIHATNFPELYEHASQSAPPPPGTYGMHICVAKCVERHILYCGEGTSRPCKEVLTEALCLHRSRRTAQGRCWGWGRQPRH